MNFMNFPKNVIICFVVYMFQNDIGLMNRDKIQQIEQQTDFTAIRAGTDV